MNIDEKKLEKLLKSQQDKTERYIGVLKEDFDHKLDAVLEYVKDTPKIKESVSDLKDDVDEIKPVLNATFEKVGELARDAESTKKDIEKHSNRLQVLEVR